MSLRPPHRCPNCRAPRTGEWCAQCGQRLATRRMVLRHVLGDLVEELIEFELPILRTVWGMTVRPGAVCRAYLIGRRKRYSNPVRYFLLLGALYVLLMQTVGVSPSDSMMSLIGSPTPSGPGAASATEPSAKDKHRQAAIDYVQHEAPKHVEHALNIISLVVTPITALIYLLVVRGHGIRRRRYGEHLAVTLFIYGQLLLFGAVASLIANYTSPWVLIAMQPLEVVYVAWAIAVCYRIAAFGAAWRSLVIFVLNFIAIGIISIAWVITWIVWLFASGEIWNRVVIPA